jgi:hypothetical protein
VATTLQIKHRCPHCSELSDFALSQLSEIREFGVPEGEKPLWDLVRDRNNGQITKQKSNIAKEGCSLSRCPRCYNPVMFVVSAGSGLLSHLSQQMRQADNYNRYSFNESDFNVVCTFPERKAYESHPAWPERIRKPFIDTQMMFDEGKSLALVISGCRSVLDAATKEAGGVGENIFGRIEDLAKKNIITNSLKEWSHIVRKIGANATHDLDIYSQTEVKEILEFIKLLLHVVFELPESIERQKLPVVQVE